MKKILSLVMSLLFVYYSFGIIASAEKKQYNKGDIIEFGSYPQTEVKNEILLKKLNSLELKWTSYRYYSQEEIDYSYDSRGETYHLLSIAKPHDFMKYADVELDGEKYRAVTFNKYRPAFTEDEATAETDKSSSFQPSNGYTVNRTYWFKYDPIKWCILDPDKGLVLCETIIDGQPFNNVSWCASGHQVASFTLFTDVEMDNYAWLYSTSSIREWLNNDFYNTAFSDSQKRFIKDTELENKSYEKIVAEDKNDIKQLEEIKNRPFYEDKNCIDKVYFLSYADLMNEDYGFEIKSIFENEITEGSINHNDRNCPLTSDYSKCQGIIMTSSLLEMSVKQSNYDKEEFRKEMGYTSEDWDFIFENGVSPWMTRTCISNYGSSVRGGYYVADTGYDGISGVRPAMTLQSFDFGDSNPDEPEKKSFIALVLEFFNNIIDFFRKLFAFDL